MANQTRRQLILATAGTWLLAGLPACQRQQSPAPAPGDIFPAFTLPDIDGRATALSSFRSTVLIVNFWATWCEPCRLEMPSLQALAANYRLEDLQVIGVTIDDDLNLTKEFRLRYNLTFPLLSDHDQSVSKKLLSIASIPMTFILTRERRIAWMVSGERDWADTGTVKEIETTFGLRPRAAR